MLLLLRREDRGDGLTSHPPPTLPHQTTPPPHSLSLSVALEQPLLLCFSLKLKVAEPCLNGCCPIKAQVYIIFIEQPQHAVMIYLPGNSS